MNGPVLTPTLGVDPRTALATSMHAAPGIYAALIGSGMSSAAGIPTGWKVVQDLIRKVARAEGVSDEDVGQLPELWWSQQGRSEPRYDTLLAALAQTDAARQALLTAYFDPPLGSGGPVHPTSAHEALAKLVSEGRIRVVVTTNFDRLIERALEAAGAPPQVISSPNMVAGMTPLPHARATVIKLHGDYTMLGLRNTPKELAEYPGEWKQLLARIFDEYGLVVVGWSADYDVALAESMARCASRRYPTYWTSYNGVLTEPARRLIALRQAAVIETTGADEFLNDLLERIHRLDQVAARRGRPTSLRTYSQQPNSVTPPEGWAALPLLYLRTAVLVGPATADACGLLRPENREALINCLRDAAVTVRLRYLSSAPAAPAETGEESAPGTPEPLFDWEAPSRVFQSTEFACYRLGGDARSGISCLATVAFPRWGVAISSVTFRMDIALSLRDAIRLAEAAQLWRDGLVLMTAVLPEALADVLPSDAEPYQIEIHALASRNPGGQNRANELPSRIDLSLLGQPTRPLGESIGYAAQVSGPLSEREAAEAVVEGIDYMALVNGYLDPRIGIDALKYELGLTTAAEPIGGT